MVKGSYYGPIVSTLEEENTDKTATTTLLRLRGLGWPMYCQRMKSHGL